MAMEHSMREFHNIKEKIMAAEYNSIEHIIADENVMTAEYSNYSV